MVYVSCDNMLSQNTKGEKKMAKSILKETTEILKRLSPENQSYFMTMVYVAQTAENNVKKNLLKKQESCRGV